MAAHPLPIPDKKTKFDKQTFLIVAPRLWKLIKPQKKHILIGMLALVFASSINLFIPYLIRNFINQDFSNLIKNSYIEVSIGLILIFVIQGYLFYLRHYHLQVIGLKIVTSLKNEMFDKLLSHQITFFDQSRSGDLLSRLNLDTDILQKGISVNISVVLRYGLQVIAGTFLMLYISPLLTLTIICVIPLIAIFSISFSKNLKSLSKKTQNAIGKSIVAAEEAISAIRVVKLFNTENFEQKKYEALNHASLELGDKRILSAAIFSSSMVTIMHLAMAFVFILGSYLVVQNLLSIGDLTAFLLYCTIVAISFGFLLNAWAEFVQSLGAAERIYSIIDGAHEDLDQKENNGSEKLQILPTNFDIQINNLSFSYPTRAEQLILSSVTCKIPENKTTAIVGPSGGGKSSLVALIPRLYDNYSGSIRIGNIETKEMSLSKLRNLISFVPQNPQLFSSSIRENIIYGKTDVSEQDLICAIKDSALDELILKLANGLDTEIGDKGIQLSGGEKQRISLARALLRKPKILVLDEATSSLDSHNEFLIQNALDKLKSNRTVIIIAHRLSTVKNADQVLVLNNGKIEEIGTHDELISKQGMYSELVKFQLR